MLDVVELLIGHPTWTAIGLLITFVLVSRLPGLHSTSLQFRQRIAGTLAAAVIILLGLVALTDTVMPPTVSRCGRLVRFPLSRQSLSLVHSRLDLPATSHWRQIRLAYSLKPDEALSLVVHRSGNTLVTLRLSRHPRLSEAMAIYRDGVLERLEALPPGGESGTLEMRRDAAGLQVVRNGVPWASLTGTDAPTGDAFEVALYPAETTTLNGTVMLLDVILDDGSALSQSVVSFLAHSRSVVFLLLVVLVLPFHKSITRLLGWLFPFQMDERPHDIAWLLICFVVPLAIVQMIPEEHRVQYAGRLNARLFLFILFAPLMFLAIAFGWARDRILTRVDSLRRSWLMHWALVPPTFFLFIYACTVIVMLGSKMFLVQRLPSGINPAPPDDKPVMACVGGSVTRGHPFEDDSAFPSVLQTLLRSGGQPRATVFNLGVDAGNSRYISTHLPDWLSALHPSVLIVMAVVNDGPTPTEDYRRNLDEILSVSARGGVKRVVLVKELFEKDVYSYSNKGPREEPRLYSVLDGFAAADGVVVVDPLPDFVAHRDEFLFMDDAHLTARGYTLLAEALARALHEFSVEAASPPLRTWHGRGVRTASSPARWKGVDELEPISPLIPASSHTAAPVLGLTSLLPGERVTQCVG